MFASRGGFVQRLTAAVTQQRGGGRVLAVRSTGSQPLRPPRTLPNKCNNNNNWWHSPEWWGFMGAVAGWGLSGSAIYDSINAGPEVISLTMTPVLIVYSTLCAIWSYVILPPNYLLLSCHIANVGAQCHQLRRGVVHQWQKGEQKVVRGLAQQAALGALALTGTVLVAPIVRQKLIQANAGILSSIAEAPAGPFTVHFWAPMSKWLISGASFLELDRPTEKISLAQYSALTVTGFFFARYSLLVKPINYNLSSVNAALFLSSAWHLGRKLKADYTNSNSKN